MQCQLHSLEYVLTTKNVGVSMNDIKIANYSLIALLVLTFTAFIYTCSIININSNINSSNSKVVAAFQA